MTRSTSTNTPAQAGVQFGLVNLKNKWDTGLRRYVRFCLLLFILFPLQGCETLDEMFASSSNANPVDEEAKANYEAFPFINMAPSAPPQAKYEPKGNPPGNIPDEYTWKNGYWDYLDGQGFLWVSGKWIRKPAFSAAWKQYTWMQRTYGWTLVPGHWE